MTFTKPEPEVSQLDPDTWVVSYGSARGTLHRTVEMQHIGHGPTAFDYPWYADTFTVTGLNGATTTWTLPASPRPQEGAIAHLLAYFEAVAETQVWLDTELQAGGFIEVPLPAFADHFEGVVSSRGHDHTCPGGAEMASYSGSDGMSVHGFVSGSFERTSRRPGMRSH